MLDSNFFRRSTDVFLPPRVVETLNRVVVGNKKTGWYVDGWSGMHVLTGLLCGVFLLALGLRGFGGFLVALLIHTVWELWQVHVGLTYIPSFNPVTNRHDALTDTAFFLLGVWLTMV